MLRLVSLCLLMTVSACATVRTTGSFIDNAAPSAMGSLATDAAAELAQLYPPAHTEVSLVHAAEDAFGRQFITELRGHGFAVAETRSRGTQLTLSYAVDEVESLYRVLLRVSTDRRRINLARGYSHRAGAVRAAGAWTQQVVP